MTGKNSPVSLVVSVSEAMLLLGLLDYLQNCLIVKGQPYIHHIAHDGNLGKYLSYSSMNMPF